MKQLAFLIILSTPSSKNIMTQISSHSFWLNQLTFTVFCITSTLRYFWGRNTWLYPCEHTSRACEGIQPRPIIWYSAVYVVWIMRPYISSASSIYAERDGVDYHHHMTLWNPLHEGNKNQRRPHTASAGLSNCMQGADHHHHSSPSNFRPILWGRVHESRRCLGSNQHMRTGWLSFWRH